MNVEQAAEYLGVAPKTLRDRRHDRKIPSMKVGRAIRFLPEDLRAWVEQQRAQPTLWELQIFGWAAKPGAEGKVIVHPGVVRQLYGEAAQTAQWKPCNMTAWSASGTWQSTRSSITSAVRPAATGRSS